MSKERKKKMPRPLYDKIFKRFLDVRFSGVEDAINAQDNSELKNKRKNIKDDYYQSVYGSTSFHIKKHKKGEPLNYRDGYDFNDTMNNYQEDAKYTGHATLRMYRHYKGKKHYYLITVQDIPEESKYE
tara:strand:+ start:80 stop:463 length:384 start_codon:yes stop_codon:yes gene_type:complete